MDNIDETYFKAITKILRLGHQITDQVTQRLKPFDITEPQFNVLRILKGQNGQAISVQDIQKRMIQRSSNVTRIVDKLIDKGLVNRSICESNRRKMDITITDQGMTTLEMLSAEVYLMHGGMKSKLSLSELENLDFLLNKLKTGI